MSNQSGSALKETGNRYDLMELAGAFGDLGTLIPFILAYITILGIDPVGLLFMFGLAKIATGLLYKTPIPVQPMKAIGASSVAQAAAFTSSRVGCRTVYRLVWLILGYTGIVTRVAALAAPPPFCWTQR